MKRFGAIGAFPRVRIERTGGGIGSYELTIGVVDIHSVGHCVKDGFKLGSSGIPVGDTSCLVSGRVSVVRNAKITAYPLPAGDLTLSIKDRRGLGEKPPIDAVGAQQAMRHREGLAGPQSRRPGARGRGAVVRVKRARQPACLFEWRRLTGVGAPAGRIMQQPPVGQGLPEEWADR